MEARLGQDITERLVQGFRRGLRGEGESSPGAKEAAGRLRPARARARSPQSQVPALTQHTSTGQSQGPCVSKTSLSAVRHSRRAARGVLQRQQGQPSAGQRPAEWTQSGRQGRGEVRSDLKEGQRRVQIGEAEGWSSEERVRGGPERAGEEPRTLYGVTGGKGATREGCMEELPCLPST